LARNLRAGLGPVAFSRAWLGTGLESVTPKPPPLGGGSIHFKNLETPTKMDRVAGIHTGGSERAFDLFMKARFLGEQHPGHGVTFATGTPISNTMVELYTMCRYLDPKGLSDRGLEHFDGWAATNTSRRRAMDARRQVCTPAAFRR